MTRPSRFRRTSFCIGQLIVECEVKLGTRAPHVSADSPRFMEPGSRAKMISLRVFKDRVDVTAELDPAALKRLRARACRLAGVSGPGVLPPSNPALLFREAGHE